MRTRLSLCGVLVVALGMVWGTGCVTGWGGGSPGAESTAKVVLPKGEGRGESTPYPDPPVSIVPSPFSGGVTLTWSPSPQADVVLYRVWKKEGGKYTLLGEAEGLEYTLSCNEVGRRAMVAVSAVDRDGLESALSDPLLLSETAPPVPAGLSVSSGGLRECVLAWSVPDDNARYYRMERSMAPGGPFQPIARIAPKRGTHVDRGERGMPLGDSTPYHYRLIAVGAGGKESSPSEAVRAVTGAPPLPPTGLNAETPAGRAVGLSWKASSSEGVISYVVERTRSDEPCGWVEAGTASGTEFFEGGRPGSPLADSTRYLYRVASVNRVGSRGGPSESVEVRTRPPPRPVRALVAEERQVRCVPLSWLQSPEEEVVRYDVYRADHPGDAFALIASVKGRGTTSYLDGGSDPGTLEDRHTYSYRVRAVNDVTAESENSDTVRATTRERPPAVTRLRAASLKPREVPLAWAESVDEKVAGYDIARVSAAADEGQEEAFSSIANLRGRETTTYVDKGRVRRPTDLGTLDDGAEYRYRIAAYNTARVYSEWSEPASATTKPVPDTPAAPRATTNLPRSVRIDWCANSEPDIAAYVVESSSSSGSGFRAIGRVENELTFTDSGHRDGEARFYRIKAVDADTLQSEPSDAVEGVAKRVPDAPANLAVAFDEAWAYITWDPPGQPDVRRYNVWKKELLTWKKIGDAKTPQYRVPVADVGGKAVVAVSSVDADDLEGPRSDLLQIIPPKSP